MVTRRAFLRWLLGLGTVGVALGGYAVAIEPGLRLRVRRWSLTPPRWPRGRPLRLVVLADLHAGGPWMSEARIRRIVATANDLRGDAILLLGDYRASHRFVRNDIPVEQIAPLLAALDAPQGVHGVLGNHDWWDDSDAQRRGSGPTRTHAAFARAGIPLLDNAVATIQAGGRPVQLLGLGDQLAFPRWLRAAHGGPPRNHPPSLDPSQGVDDLDGLVAQADPDAPAILLAHEPDIFPRAPDQVALTVSGHTHGGQVRLFGHSPVVPSRYGNRYAYGVIEETGRMLAVSGGLGCSIAPIRFGVPPEITVIDLA